MSEILVSPSEIRNKAEQLKNLNNSFRHEVEKMIGYQQSLNSMWEGEAKEAFNRAFQTDRSKWESFAKNIDDFVTKILIIVTTWENAEKQAVQIASTRSSGGSFVEGISTIRINPTTTVVYAAPDPLKNLVTNLFGSEGK